MRPAPSPAPHCTVSIAFCVKQLLRHAICHRPVSSTFCAMTKKRSRKDSRDSRRAGAAAKVQNERRGRRRDTERDAGARRRSYSAGAAAMSKVKERREPKRHPRKFANKHAPVSESTCTAACASGDESPPTPKEPRRVRRKKRVHAASHRPASQDSISSPHDARPSAAACASNGAGRRKAAPAARLHERVSESPEASLSPRSLSELVEWSRPLDRAIHYFLRDNGQDPQPYARINVVHE